jgi:hypothetical protein
MPTLVCERCGTPLTGAQQRRFCRLACYHAWQADRASAGIVARFWGKVQKTPGCWFWRASTVRGYGQFTQRSPGSATTHVPAHRLAWTLTYGPIPDNLSVLHRCDTPLCVRPDHLFLGTQADNLHDARAKGRLVDGRHLIKVDDAGLADIQANYRPKQNGKALAEKYGITLVHLMRLVNGTGRVRRPRFQRVPSRQIAVRVEVA